MGAVRTAQTSPRAPRSRSVPQAKLADPLATLFRTLDRTAVMGVLNVTPDSFSDGGRFVDRRQAVRHALRLSDEGADVIDVGGESTRPGADRVPVAEEIRRVVPVIHALRDRLPIPISIDTTRAEVAAAALEAGATIVNDVSAGRADRGMLPLVAGLRAGIILMHRKGTPRSMQVRPRYRDVVGEVRAFLARRAARAIDAGVSRESIAVDPGIGFGKTLAHNLQLLRSVDRIAAIGYPVVVGVSRKSFLGKILGLPVGERLEGSLAAALVAIARGVRMVRVHDVAATVRALRVAEAIWRGEGR